MKKLTIVFAGFVLFILSSSFAFTDSVTAKIKSVFEKDFAACSDLTWTKYEDVYVASFKIKDVPLTAAYNENAELLAVSRNIAFSQLPLKVSKAIEEKYGTYAIDQTVIELSADQTSYFVNVENEKAALKIKSDASGYLTVENKIKKKPAIVNK
jgi:glycine cleavage system H lipoate-binding protein